MFFPMFLGAFLYVILYKLEYPKNSDDFELANPATALQEEDRTDPLYMYMPGGGL